MSETVRLYIVTDDPKLACLAVLGCALSELPFWARILTTPKEIAGLPDGAPAQGRWYAARPTLAELSWNDRKAGAGFGLSAALQDGINAWIAKRAAAERALIAEACAEARPAPAAPQAGGWH